MEIQRRFSGAVYLMVGVAMGLFLFFCSTRSAAAADVWTGTCACPGNPKPVITVVNNPDGVDLIAQLKSWLSYCPGSEPSVSCSVKKNTVEVLNMPSPVTPPLARKFLDNLRNTIKATTVSPYKGDCLCTFSDQNKTPQNFTFDKSSTLNDFQQFFKDTIAACYKDDATASLKCTGKTGSTTVVSIDAGQESIANTQLTSPAEVTQVQYAAACTCKSSSSSKAVTLPVPGALATAASVKDYITKTIDICYQNDASATLVCNATESGSPLYAINATSKADALKALEKTVSATATGGATTNTGTGSGWGMGQSAQVSGLEWVKPELEVPVEGTGEFAQPEEGPCSGNLLQVGGKCIQIPWIAQYLKAIFFWGLGIGALLAVMLLAFGGILYISAGAMPGNIAKAKEYMFSGVYGLLILLGSYILLNTINPRLVNLYPIEIEVAKKQIIEDNVALFCEEMIQKYKAPDYQLTLEAYNPATAKCGDGRTYKATVKTAKGEILTLTNPTCSSNNCGQNTTKNCVMGLQTTTYSCQDVIVYGRVMYPNMENLMQCGKEVESIIKNLGGSDSAFYLDEVQLRAATKDEKDIELTPKIEIGRRNNYNIPRSMLKEAKINALPDDAKVYLWVDINDASFNTWGAGFGGIAGLVLSQKAGAGAVGSGISMAVGAGAGASISINDAFYAVPYASSKDLPNAKLLKPAVICKGTNGFTFSTVTKRGNGYLYEGLNTPTWGQLKGGSVYWDMDITKAFFDCAEGNTISTNSSQSPWYDLGSRALEAMGAYDACKYASQTVPGTQGYGQQCTYNNDCKPAVSGAVVQEPIMYCMGAKGLQKHCLTGTWSDLCESDCSEGFTCDKNYGYGFHAGFVCVADRAGYLQHCNLSLGEKACQPGLACRNRPTTCSQKANPGAYAALGCKYDAGVNEETDPGTTLCLPLVAPDLTAGNCVCACKPSNDNSSDNTNSDCPATASRCVDSEATYADFCTSGLAGTPCMKGLNCQDGLSCNHQTCYYGRGFYSTHVADFSSLINWVNYFTNPLSDSTKMKPPY